MTDRRPQLTRARLVGMLMLGLCTWGILIGIGWAIFANLASGLITAGAGLIGALLILWWLFITGEKR